MQSAVDRPGIADSRRAITGTAPEFSIPLGATLAAVVGSTGFALVLNAIVAAQSPAEQPWPAAAGVFDVLAVAAWAGLLHAIATRRMFRGCRLHLGTGDFRPDVHTAFEIADPQRRLRALEALEIGLAWREISTREGGRKTYNEGPFELSSAVRWAHRDALPAAGGAGLAGEFEVARSELRLKPVAGWTQRVELLLRLRTSRWRSCSFVLPLEG